MFGINMLSKLSCATATPTGPHLPHKHTQTHTQKKSITKEPLERLLFWQTSAFAENLFGLCGCFAVTRQKAGGTINKEGSAANKIRLIVPIQTEGY